MNSEMGEEEESTRKKKEEDGGTLSGMIEGKNDNPKS
jgi:hypothetical protein